MTYYFNYICLFCIKDSINDVIVTNNDNDNDINNIINNISLPKHFNDICSICNNFICKEKTIFCMNDKLFCSLKCRNIYFSIR